MAFLIKTTIFVLALYAVIVVGAYYVQRLLMYFPDRSRVAPMDAGLADVEERVLATADGNRVIAWYGRAQPGGPTILYFHGNAGSLATRADRIRNYLAHGHGMFMMTYRGYGGSTGAPSERANVVDGMLAYDALLREGVRPEDVIVYGESLGSGVAVQVAAAKPVAGLILDAPYTSMVDLAAGLYPYLPVRLLLRDRYEIRKYLDRLRAPLLVVHGEEDEIIPVTMGRAVFAAARGPKEIATFAGAGHSDHHAFGSYDVINDWIDRLRTGRAGRAAE